MLILKDQYDIAKDIAIRIKNIRHIRKMSQKDLATRSGISYGSIKRFEQTGEISFVSLITLCRVLEIENEFDDLFNDYEK